MFRNRRRNGGLIGGDERNGWRQGEWPVERRSQAGVRQCAVGPRPGRRLLLAPAPRGGWNRPTMPIPTAPRSLISPKVAGYVVKLAVGDNTPVKAGDTILEIDPRDYLVARDKAVAAQALAQAQLGNVRTGPLEIAKVKYPCGPGFGRSRGRFGQGQLCQEPMPTWSANRRSIHAQPQQQIDAARQADLAASATLDDAEAKLKTAQLVQQNIAEAEAQVQQLEAQLASRQGRCRTGGAEPVLYPFDRARRWSGHQAQCRSRQLSASPARRCSR